MKDSIKCLYCNFFASKELIFCPRCGSNLHAPEVPLDTYKQKKEIDKIQLLRYINISKKIKELGKSEQELIEQENECLTLKSELDKVDVTFQKLNLEVNEYKGKIKDLNKLSWESFKAKILRKHKQGILALEKKYSQYVEDEENTRKVKENLEQQFNQQLKKYNEFKRNYNKKKALERELEEIVHLACEGVSDPITNKIELDLKLLRRDLQPFIEHKVRIITSIFHIQQASDFFKEIMHGNNTLKYTEEELNSVKDDLLQVIKFLLEIQQSRVSIISREFSSWINSINQVIKDLKMSTIRSRVRMAIIETNKILSWLNSLRSAMEYETQITRGQVTEKQEELTKERVRIIENELAKTKKI